MMDKKLYSADLEVRWGDIDALGHVNNARYFTFFEHARAIWMREHNIFYMPGGEVPVLVAVSAAFRKEITFPAQLNIDILLGKVGSRSLQTLYQIRDSKDASIIYATGEATQVWVDTAVQKAVRLPAAVLKYLEQYN
jgi:acyl-CoA thioester hydrolase